MPEADSLPDQHAPDGSFSVSQSQNGRLMSAVQKDSTGSQLSSATYDYDTHWPPVSNAIDAGMARRLTDTTTPTSWLAHDSSPRQWPIGATTFTYYNSRLQVSSILAPDGGTTTFEYYPSGEMKRSYGVRLYPVGYSYDTRAGSRL